MKRAVGVEVWMIFVCLILIVHSHSVYARNITEAWALNEFKTMLEGNQDYINHLLKWNLSSPEAPCDWKNMNYNISCDDHGYVSSIILNGAGIGGIINGSVFSYFPKLNNLELSYNNMYGSIPNSFGNINFTRLVLNDNRINGRIPCSLGKKYEISYMDLRSNLLTGCVPTHLANKKDIYYGDNPGLKGTCTDC